MFGVWVVYAFRLLGCRFQALAWGIMVQVNMRLSSNILLYTHRLLSASFLWLVFRIL